MTTTCKNCNNQFKGNYCFHCGQTADTHHINFHFLWHDIQHGLLHVDKGLFFTIRELFTRPGYSIKEFLDGKRVKHFKPISLVLVLAGVFGLLFHFFHISMLDDTIEIGGSDPTADRLRNLLAVVNDWISGHYALVSFLQLPLYSIGTYLAFRKLRYNFVEHLVINAFLTGQRIVLRIALFPLYYALNETPSIKILGSALNLVNVALTMWAFSQLFQLGKTATFWRTILSFIISFSLTILITSLLFLAFGRESLTH